MMIQRTPPHHSPRRGGVITATTALVALLVAACAPVDGGSASTSEKPAGGESSVTVVQSALINTYDPKDLNTGTAQMVNQLYDTLIRLDENFEPQPALAESWDLAPDGLSLTLTLRDDVVFHDGSSFGAQDVADNIARYADPEEGANQGAMARAIADVEVVDPGTVRLLFDEPLPWIFDALDLFYLAKVQDDPDAIARQPIGTGPYVLESHSDEKSVFTAFDQYWNKDAVSVERAEVRVITDAQAALVAFESGEADAIIMAPWQDLERLEGSGHTVDLLGMGSRVVMLTVNTNAEPLDNPLVRQALHHAMDRSRFVDTYLYGYGEAWCLPWHERSLAFDARARDCEQDLDEAKRLLAEAGLPDGFSTTITTTGARLVGSEALGQILQAEAAKVGIDIEIVSLEATEAVARQLADPPEYDLFGANIGRATRDPATVFGGTVVYRPDGNAEAFASDDYADLVQRAGSSLDEAERRALYGELNDLLLHESFAMPIAVAPVNTVRSPAITGWSTNADGAPYLAEVVLNG